MYGYALDIAVQGGCPALVPAASYYADGRKIVIWDKSGHIVTNYHVIDGGAYVVASLHRELGGLERNEVDGILLARDARDGLEGEREAHRHARGDSPENAACVVGGGENTTFPHLIGVIVLAAVHAGSRESRTEFDSLDSGDAEEHACEL